MARKLKAAELFLSLGLVASLATACGGPTEGDDVTEPDGAAIETPADETVTPETPVEEAEESEEGGEGGEGGEG